MEKGTLIEAGCFTSIDNDENMVEYNYALIIEFDTVEEFKQALKEGVCEFRWSDVT